MSFGPISIVVGHGIVPRVNLALFTIDGLGRERDPSLFVLERLSAVPVNSRHHRLFRDTCSWRWRMEIAFCLATRLRGVGLWVTGENWHKCVVCV